MTICTACGAPVVDDHGPQYDPTAERHATAERIRERIEAEAYEEWENDLGTKVNRKLLPSRVHHILDEEAAR